MNKPVIAVTGGNGLVGSAFVAKYAEQFEFVALDISDPVQPVDITDYSQVMRAVENKGVSGIVHFAAFTDVTAAWKQSGDKTGLAYRVNVTGTEVMVRAANEVGAHFIQISTAYVFDGEKEGNYTESDAPHPIEWYGQTKLLAEEVVQASTAPWTVLRIDQPFRQDAFAKADTLHRVLAGLQAGTLYPQFTDHFFGPTYIPDFAAILSEVLEKKVTGLYHATSGERWSDFAFAQAVATANGLDPAQVKPGSLTEYLRTSERPYQRNTALDASALYNKLSIKPSVVSSVLSVR